MQWPVVELAEWEELRRCPVCESVWLAIWPEDVDGGMVFCRPQPEDARRLRDVDRAATMRGYCLARLEEHFGTLDERKTSCRKVACPRKRIGPTSYCVEHLIAERFGRHLANLDERGGSPRNGAKPSAKTQSIADPEFDLDDTDLDTESGDPAAD